MWYDKLMSFDKMQAWQSILILTIEQNQITEYQWLAVANKIVRIDYKIVGLANGNVAKYELSHFISGYIPVHWWIGCCA